MRLGSVSPAVDSSLPLSPVRAAMGWVDPWTDPANSISPPRSISITLDDNLLTHCAAASDVGMDGSPKPRQWTLFLHRHGSVQMQLLTSCSQVFYTKPYAYVDEEPGETSHQEAVRRDHVQTLESKIQ